MKKNHLILFILLGLNLSSVYSIQAFAVQQEESQTEENQIPKMMWSNTCSISNKCKTLS